MLKLCLVVFLLAIVVQASSSNVPALIFGSESPSFLPTLQALNGDEFVTLVKSQVNSDTLTVVFVENNLSVEDLSCTLKTKTCFENLRKLDKTYVSSVEQPVDSLISAFGNKNSVSLGSDDDLKEVNLESSTKILFVYLDDAERAEDFAKHDDLMMKLTKELKTKFSNVVAIYTGIHPSFKYSKKLVRKTRETESVAAAPQDLNPDIPAKVFLTEKHVLIALKQIIITDKKAAASDANRVITINATDISLAVSNITEDKFVTSFVTTLSKGDEKLDIITSISAGTWEAVFKYKDNDPANEQFHARTAVVGYGENYSFGCGDLYIESFNREIRLIGFQYQPSFEPAADLNLDTRKFSTRYSDCVGYFTPGIWGALFIVILLMSIMTYGISMMMDIRTMDKFDDPKGKTITVSTAE